MEIEYHDDRRRGKVLVVAGLILAIGAGVGAFFLLSQAQQQAGQAALPMARVVVATKVIAARVPITAIDVALKDIPLDPANTAGVVATVEEVIGRIPAVTILQDQIITSNMLASTTEGGQFTILQPDETIGPDSEAWRAVSITVPDDLAVGGMLEAGQTVDVFVTAVVAVTEEMAATGRYISDRSTKVTYQDVVILARDDAFYVIRVPLDIAEEIAHLQASGIGTFSLALRPEADRRPVDTADLGETTNQIITKYGLPIPEPIEPSANARRGAPALVGTPQPSPTPAP